VGSWMRHRVSESYISARRVSPGLTRSEWFWSYMQYHWEETLNAKSALSISGDDIPNGESAVVVSVRIGLHAP